MAICMIPDRFEKILTSIKTKGANPATDVRWDVIARIEERSRERKNSPQNGASL